MQLPRCAGQHGARADPAVPPAREAEQPPAEELRREVLLRDRGVTALPAVTELAEDLHHGFVEHRVEAPVREQPVEGRVRAGVVEAVECLAQRVDRLLRGDPARLGHPAGDLRSLPGGQTAGQELPHPPDPGHVLE